MTGIENPDSKGEFPVSPGSESTLPCDLPAAWRWFAPQSGLLDTMEDPAAGRMVSALASALRPGGQLLVAAMARSIRCDGYLDAFMDWQPVLRGEDEMQALMAHARGPDIASRPVFHGSNGAMLYGSVLRRS